MEKIIWSAQTETLHLLLRQTQEPHLDGFDKTVNTTLGYVLLDEQYCYPYAIIDRKDPYLIRSRKIEDLEAAKHDVVRFLLETRLLKPDQLTTEEELTTEPVESI